MGDGEGLGGGRRDVAVGGRGREAALVGEDCDGGAVAGGGLGDVGIAGVGIRAVAFVEEADAGVAAALVVEGVHVLGDGMDVDALTNGEGNTLGRVWGGRGRASDELEYASAGRCEGESV